MRCEFANCLTISVLLMIAHANLRQNNFRNVTRSVTSHNTECKLSKSQFAIATKTKHIYAGFPG